MFEYFVVVMDSSATVHKICKVVRSTGVIDSDVDSWAKESDVNHDMIIWASYAQEVEQLKMRYFDGSWKVVV